MTDKKYPALKGYVEVDINGVRMKLPIALWKFEPKPKEEQIF